MKQVDFIGAKRVHPIIYVLLSNNYCTLKELRDDYTIEEALDMYETCMTNLHNKAAACINNSKTKNRRR